MTRQSPVLLRLLLLTAIVLGCGAHESTADAHRLQPRDLVYAGAFRLPADSGGSNWEYAGYAMTYCPNGDPQGADDGFPGSLFAVGHDHQQYVSEISIPVPGRSAAKKAAELPSARTLQPFRDVTGGRFGELEIPRAGLAWMAAEGGQGRGRLHFCWGQHFQFEHQPSHGWCELDLAAPKTAGPWRLGSLTNHVTNDYLFEIPKIWADAHVGGRRLATGRFRDGTWSGLGPALVAYAPPPAAKPPAPGAVLPEPTTLLLYGRAVAGAAEIDVSAGHRMTSFKEADEWSGGAWLTAGAKTAVVLVGTKATGKCWYGFANGVVYPTSGDPGEAVPEVPPWPHDSRGWWSEGIEAQVLFYDPADLAAVAAGTKPSWAPQPYARLKLDPFLLDPSYDHRRAKRYLVGAAAFDRARGHLFVMERRADEDKSLVHVFQVRAR